jgi:hypothetical protein
VLKLFLIKPPAATGRPHSSANFACPYDIVGSRSRTNRIYAGSSASGGSGIGPGAARGTADSSAPCLGPRFAYTALRQLQRSMAERGVRVCARVRLDHSEAMEFTVVAESINQGPGTCEDCEVAAFLNQR